MHLSGPLPFSFEGPEQCFGGKNCQIGSRGSRETLPVFLFIYFVFRFTNNLIYIESKRVDICGLYIYGLFTAMWERNRGFTRSRGYKYFSKLNTNEQEFFPAHIC